MSRLQMKRKLTKLFLLALASGSFLAAAGEARAYTVNLIYYTSRALADQFGISLQDGDIVQLIYSSDNVRNPPNIYNGMPTGDDVLWESTVIGQNMGGDPGKFLELFQYDSSLSGGKVYIRFFNAPVMGQVTYYGMSPLHVLSDMFGIDVWDVTAGGLYLWTEYPFIVIPEPETWLTLLPAVLLGMYMYRRNRKKTARTG